MPVRLAAQGALQRFECTDCGRHWTRKYRPLRYGTPQCLACLAQPPQALTAERACATCGVPFALQGPNSRYCSAACGARAERQRRDADNRVRKGRDDLRRARLLGAVREPIDRRAVFDRDGWRCGLCGGSIDQAAQHPDPLSASLDHVLPLARGGSHTYSNVQAAHLRCNVAKGARA